MTVYLVQSKSGRVYAIFTKREDAEEYAARSWSFEASVHERSCFTESLFPKTGFQK